MTVTTAIAVTVFGCTFRLELWRDILTNECERDGRREFVRVARHRFMPWRLARFVHQPPGEAER